jgi:hypothetical protein
LIKLTITFHIKPLDIFPVFTSREIFFHIFEFISNIRCPSDLFLGNWNLGAFTTVRFHFPEFESIIKVTFSNKTTWNSWIIISKGISFNIFSLIGPEISYFDNWVTFLQIISFLVQASKLFIVSGFDISSMVLIEVVKLIVDINRALNLFFDILEISSIFNCAPIWHSCTIWSNGSNILYYTLVNAFLIISVVKFNNSITHHLQHNTDG